MVVPENAPFRTCQAEGQTVFPVSFRLDNRNLSCTRSADVQIEAYLQWLAFLDHSQALCSLPLQVQSPRVPIVPYREELFPV